MTKHYFSMTFEGVLGRDPEKRFTPSGVPVTSMSVAVGRDYKGSNGDWVKQTIWFKVSAWNKAAETCDQYLKKGSHVIMDVELVPDPKTGNPRVWESNGNHGASYETRLVSLRMLDTKTSSETEKEIHQDEPDENDIPF